MVVFHLRNSFTAQSHQKYKGKNPKNRNKSKGRGETRTLRAAENNWDLLKDYNRSVCEPEVWFRKTI